MLRPVGALSVTTAPRIRRAVGKALSDGIPVAVDLGRLGVTDAGAVTVFPAALQAAGGRLAASLVLYAADAATARTLAAASVPSYVPLVDDLHAALARAARRPEVVRRSVALGQEAAAVAAFRTAVREVSNAWALRAVTRELAVVVAAELVANAVAHAGGRRRWGSSTTGAASGCGCATEPRPCRRGGPLRDPSSELAVSTSSISSPPVGAPRPTRREDRVGVARGDRAGSRGVTSGPECCRRPTWSREGG